MKERKEISVKKKKKEEKDSSRPAYITWLNRLAVGGTLLAIIEAIHIMIHGQGLSDKLDFGAGAYYYADIPKFATLVNGDHFQSQVSMPVLILLFLIWGFLMYRLWVWMERKSH